MIVCHCHAVSDDRIGAEIDGGARSVDEVGDRCGAGTGCGGCRPVVEAIVATHLAHHADLDRTGRLADHLARDAGAEPPPAAIPIRPRRRA